MKKALKHIHYAGLCLLVFTGSACAQSSNLDTSQIQLPDEAAKSQTDYSSPENWAVFEFDQMDHPADVFFICPTVYSSDGSSENMPLSNEKAKADFLGATMMEKGIYDDQARFFAPYYAQASLESYSLDSEDQEVYLNTAYEDVEDAFEYYLENLNEDRPYIIAGFSQGTDMSLRLMKEHFGKDEQDHNLIACYAIGWRITEEELLEYPGLQMAQNEKDTGVIITFNSEAESVTDSIMIPEGTRTLSINPLNWKTDSTAADKTLNKGACFTDYDGNIVNEVDAFTGAWIDPVRGALKVPDVNVFDYPPGLDFLDEGVFHIYDYQFFYRNLEQNVQTRIEEFLKSENT